MAGAAPGGFLGVYLDDESHETQGAVVAAVISGSPAARAGVRPGDRIRTLAGRATPHGQAAIDVLLRRSPGEQVRLRLARGEQVLDLELSLSPWGEHHAQIPARAQPGRAILVAGHEFPIDAPVVTFRDPGGFDGYLERCQFDPASPLPARPAAGCNEPRRYAGRRRLAPALAEVVAARGWTPELAALQIDQVVLHYDVAWTSRNCFRVLHDLRGLSCHFLLDVDGTLYQTLDVVERARHAGSANDRSIGIEIAHPGPLELTRNLAARYIQDAGGVRFDLGRHASGVRTPSFVVRPARPQPVEGEVQGRRYRQYDYTELQYRTLTRLLAALARALPRLRLAPPRSADGTIPTAVLAPEALAEHRGLLGHYHVSSRKQDPGPAFDWTRVIAESRALLESGD